MAKAKRGRFPPIPRTGREFADMLVDRNAALYAAHYLESADVGEDYAFAFIAEGMRTVFLNATSVAWDGTFYVCPRPFVQYFVLHVEVTL